MSATEELGGSYEVIRRRLLDRVTELGKRAEQLDARRREVFGGSEMALAATERVRTENNCLPRDIAALGGSLLVGYDVFVGMKTEVLAPDIFALHRLVRDESGALTFEPFAVDAQTFLTDERFLKDFGDLFRYVREARIRQLRVTPTRLLAIFGTGASARDQKVFRWSIDAAGRLAYLDARGEDDNVRPRAHDFTWKLVGREQHVAGKHPHVSILDEVFVETVGGDLTIKVENNTEGARGSTPSPSTTRTSPSTTRRSTTRKLGALILLKIKPYREERAGYLIFNTRTPHGGPRRRHRRRVWQLPEDHGRHLPGRVLPRQTGESKVFDDDGPMTLKRAMVKSPNGEDVLYVFYREGDGTYVLLPYNLIRKEVAARGVVPRVLDLRRRHPGRLSRGPRRRAHAVHPLQVWQTPFFSAEHAAAAPTRRLAPREGRQRRARARHLRGLLPASVSRRPRSPDRQTYEDLIAQAQRMRRLPLARPRSASTCLGKLKELAARPSSSSTSSRRSRPCAARRRGPGAGRGAQQGAAPRLRLTHRSRPSEFLDALTALRQAARPPRHPARDARHGPRPRRGPREGRRRALRRGLPRGREFLLGPTAPSAAARAPSPTAVKRVEAQKRTELKPITDRHRARARGPHPARRDRRGLQVDDPTLRTKILEAVSEVFSQLNRARARSRPRARKELRGAEGARVRRAVQALRAERRARSRGADSPEKCDESLARLLVQVEELEGRFGEFDEFAGGARGQSARSSTTRSPPAPGPARRAAARAQNLLGAAERILQGMLRKRADLHHRRRPQRVLRGRPDGREGARALREPARASATR
jgi:hypothetical protein